MSNSISEVIVEDVHEVNSPGGIKEIWITAQKGSDESYAAKFRLNTSWIFPEQKLQLATVQPGDLVKVVWNYFVGDLGVMGDFVSILTPLGYHRQPLCQCLHMLVSDGHQLICPNKNCILTLAAKLERLSFLKFVPEEDESFWPLQFDHNDHYVEISDRRYTWPFTAITNSSFWGQPGASLSHILEHRLTEPVCLQTFMVESEWQEWLYHTPQLNNNVRYKSLHAISQFHAAMRELFERRDRTSARQNLLMAEWLWCLGLDSLTRETIDRLVYHEKNFEDVLDSMLFYAWILTHSYEMVGEMGVDIHEARAISREIRSRRVELFDLFKHFCTSDQTEDLIKCFETLG